MLRGSTSLDEGELTRARELGHALMDACRRLDARPDAALRARAFSLLAWTYDQVRRALTYVRWDEADADALAPSIYTGSRGGRPARV